MQTFSSNGVEIAFLDTGAVGALAQPPVLLIHGFASNVAANWVNPGWVRALSEAGNRVIAFDNRGHGESAKLYELEAYGAPLMADDARALLDHLGIGKAPVVGYSMGARIAAFLTINHPSRVASAVFGGLGIHMVQGMPGRGDTIAEALEAKTLDEVTDPAGRGFRMFAEQTKSDLRALAACMRSARAPITVQALALVRCPVLVVVGSEDTVAGSGAELAKLIPGASHIDLAGRDHMRAVGDKQFKAGVIAFLAEQAP